jgi:DNA invertase Pin-like site-specific DNA recombinase
VELCAAVGALLVDEHGVYDPLLTNDRLLLGMKSTMAEMELSTLRQRSHEARKLKALIREHHEGYISWEAFEHNQHVITHTHTHTRPSAG